MDADWTPPGPGRWMVDGSHMPKGCTPIVQHVASSAMEVGMRRVFSELGAPIDCVQLRFVNGQVYSRVRPLIAPDRPSSKLPPKAVLRCVTRLHPELRRRNRRAAQVMIDEPWLAVIDEWHTTGKASIVESNRLLQQRDLSALDDAAVLQHVIDCIDHNRETWVHHFWLHGYDIGPIGQYLFEAQRWGADAAELLTLLEGASPSTSEPNQLLLEIRSAAETRGASFESLEALRASSSAIAAMIDGYLADRSAVLFSRYDIDGVTLGERPDLVLAGIANARGHDAGDAVAQRTAEVRERVPPAHRDRFDVVLRQARQAMDLRDDNGPTTVEWPLGVLRLGVLELGRRLVAAGLLPEPQLALELLPSELTPGVLQGETSAHTLVERAAQRQSQKRLVAPATLGPEEPAPPIDVLPEGLARLVSITQTVMHHMGMDGSGERASLHGIGIGTTVVGGRACIASSPEEALDMVGSGDILVVASTTPAFNLVLSLAAGVVTAEGGPMSHAAVIARELGITAIVGARGALTEIPSGALIELDPLAGVVTVL